MLLKCLMIRGVTLVREVGHTQIFYCLGPGTHLIISVHASVYA